ncbi:MAG: NAD(+) synthase [Treponema sp.]|nr:NAD(+) synthase [Treponema sp.]
MNFGFFRAACATPSVTVADTESNAQSIVELTHEAWKRCAQLVVFPELCITGYTCSDLFFQDTLQKNALSALELIAAKTADTDALISVGLPMSDGTALYNAAAVIFRGKVLAIVKKSFIPNYAEFYERRHFATGAELGTESREESKISLSGKSVPFGTRFIFKDAQNPLAAIGFEICEDLWVPLSPSTTLALSGATIIANLSASNEIIGKASYRRTLVSSQSAKTVSAYLYANAGNGESTTDLVFSGHSMIFENGTMLAEKTPFSEEKIIYADIDLERLHHERTRTTTFAQKAPYIPSCTTIYFNNEEEKNRSDKKPAQTDLSRFVSRTPFVPQDESARKERCHEVIELQAQGLSKRLRHTRAKTAVIGLSGGLDSTLALLVTCRAFDLCGLDRKNIKSVTMPCFGTTDRTYHNACSLAEETGSQLIEINIRDSVTQHFKDIGQDESVHDVTYENCQARERTQVLMDLANKLSGLVIGTGDLSEQALGWATYNGDHMSMYGVNGSIPKTLVRYLVKWFADEAFGTNQKLSAVLNDILDTPVSPELLPPDGKNISQKTEDLVGPYELHDFFLYYVLRFGFSPKKIFFLATHAFKESAYSGKTIKKWLVSFYRRFFSQQFKRSCMPDGAKVGSVNLSPRGDWRMPSDASASLWLKEAESIEV